MKFYKPRLFILPLLLFLFISAISAQKSQKNFENEINTLISKMTLAEKLGQLQMLDGEANGKFRPEHLELARKGLLGSTLNVRGALMTNELQRAALESRLKIPMLFSFDVIHGYRTIFPVPLGESASWDLASIERTAEIAAAESRAAGVHWTFAPMVDIARDPRWGRIIEGAGEDTFLGSKIAFARVRGFQGDDYSKPNRVMATAKHWVGYGAAEAGRDYNTTNISKRSLRETYFPPFKASIDAGVGSFMTAFNDLDGVPATANPFILRDVLRNEWKFDGLVVSDYTAVMELMFHGLAKDEPDAAKYALNAGTDIEMVSRLYNKYGEQLLKDKKVSLATIDEAVKNVLRIKYRLGLFNKPFADEKLEKAEVFKKANRDYAEISAEKSFVLLKNEDETLPISKNIKSVAVIGELANNKREMNGNWTGDGQPTDPITVLESLKQKYPKLKINYAKGCDAYCKTDEEFAAAVNAAKTSDFTIMVIGESSDMSAEAASRSEIDLPGMQTKLVKQIHATGKPYAVVLMNGRPLTINWLAENSPAILETWFAGTMAGNAIVDTLFGDANPGGKLPVTFPRSVGQIPIYYNHKNTGRPFLAEQKYTSKYLDISNQPLYPFGFGLSYTTFKLSNLRLDKLKIKRSENVKVTIDIENTGKVKGDEVVQLYIHDIAATVTRPVRELRGFERITLQPKEKRSVEFTLTPKDLEFLDRDLKPVLEPGEFQVIVGTSSDNGMQSVFEVLDSNNSTSKIADENVEPAPTVPRPTAEISKNDNAFLEDMSKRSFVFFWENSNPRNGLTLDRVGTDGKQKPKGHRSYNIASSAATGFALTSYCIAADRGWMPKDEVKLRTRNTLDFFANKAFHKNGWFYHWLDYETGERRWNSEISSIDTALLVSGVLTVKQCFADDKEIVNLADKIADRVDYKWMQGENQYILSHGWKPESGFLDANWENYSEEMILYLLAIGSETHPISKNSWWAWERTWKEYEGYRYLAAVSPLFIHQYSHAWVDFRGKRETRPPFVNYFENSVKATKAQQEFSADVLSKNFPKYSKTMWGLSASDSEKGYIAWGTPPQDERIDGSVVPYAVAGSLMFTPDISLPTLKEMKEKYGGQVYGKYSFADAFNPNTGWVGEDVLGIDLGISLLGAENLRTGKVWYWFMQNDDARRAFKLIGLM
ncbi:MAG: glycoside hydrolase family 3 C-terminal domain-containing protein [Acidobacteriota bacterium]|nr:glycoside hydrolase family 3 C-terminal domain-containing protein [Acidobacteriota bacterium]